MIEQTKTCIRCKQPKPANTDNFHKYPRNSDGLRSYCKPCAQDIKREWEKKHPEQVRAAKNRRNAANPEPARRRAKKWQEENPERYKANMEAWYEENGEAVKEAQRLDRLLNPEKHRERELMRSFKMTLADFEKRFNEQGKKCAACGTPEPNGKYKQWVVDHDHSCCPKQRTCGHCVRGILCQRCNLILGIARDSAERLRQAADYLDRTKKSTLTVQEEPCLT